LRHIICQVNLLCLNNLDLVYDYLKRFDIFVLASKLEGLGTSVLDAMSCGKTIVATNAGGIPEMIVDRINGLLVPKQNPEALAKSIIQLIDDSELRYKLALKAKESARLFDISKLVEQHIVLYNRLTSK
jgi:glycosyltransferase involved in cell wall biosynthesis